MGMSEHKDRVYPRVQVSATIDVNMDDIGLEFFNKIENISLGGVCIATAGDPEVVGTEVELVLNLPEDKDVILSGEVVWASIAPNPMMGVRFLDLDTDAKTKLRNYLYQS